MTPYYERAGIVLYHGDCREILPTLAQVDHVITDPPYEAEAHTMGRRGALPKTRSGAWSGSDIDIARPLGFAAIDVDVRRDVGREMARLSRGWILAFCQVEGAMLWRDAIPAKYVRTQIWRKPNSAPQFTGDRPGMGYESIVTCWAGDNRRPRWNGGGRHGVYEHSVVGHMSGHQTEKPIGLMRELVELFTDPGETILDPFAGSGTTGVAAFQLGRKASLVELEEKWCEVAAKRLEAQTPPMALEFATARHEQPVMPL